MEKDIQAQAPLAVKFKLQPGDSRYVRYVEENHHDSLRKKSLNPNYHPNELKYLPAECLMLDIMHIPAPAMSSMKYRYVMLFVCIKSDFIVPYPLENLTAQSIHDAFSYIIDFMRVRFRKKVKKILADCFTSFAEKRLVERS